jgi:hypothetical protein
MLNKPAPPAWSFTLQRALLLEEASPRNSAAHL